MKKAGKLLCSMLGIPLLVKSGVAMAPNYAAAATFPNTTSITASPDSTDPAVPCFPFEDPDCCVDYIVCQCSNGTFFTTNQQYGATSLCNPPGSFEYGDVSSIPGRCC